MPRRAIDAVADPGNTVLALDLGGTQIRTAAVTADGARLGRRAAGTPLERGADAIYDVCAELLRGTLDDLSREARTRVRAIGISSMGPVDPRRGMVVDPPNVVALHNAPLAAAIEERLGLAVFLERDTNVAALAEHWRGAARGCRDFLYVTVSTGLGGAVFTNGGLLLGPDGVAGELGHISLDMDGGPACGCGARGHLEGLASGSGLAAQARDEVAAGRSPFLTARGIDRPLSGKDVAEGDAAGDPACVRLLERARLAFAIACVGWVNAFNPDRIVVGGTLAQRQGDLWLDPARDAVRAQALRVPGSRVRIVPAELGEDVGLVGAWPLVHERFGDPFWTERRA